MNHPDTLGTRHAVGVFLVFAGAYFLSTLIRAVTATLSPVLSKARPPKTAASGLALRIDGLPLVPDCRPSPMHGSAAIPSVMR